jgi:hypothetical protein
MGRYYYDKKEEGDNLPKLSTSFLKKHGYFHPETVHKGGSITWTRSNYGGETKSSIGIVSSLVPFGGGRPFVKLNYTLTRRSTGEKEDFDYKVYLSDSACNYGGVRWWFICPLVKSGRPCNMRVGVLYLGGDYFGCRQCYNLTYASKNEFKMARQYPFSAITVERKAEALEQQIKRRYYGGKPTKKQRQLERLYSRLENIEPVDIEQLMMQMINKK